MSSSVMEAGRPGEQREGGDLNAENKEIARRYGAEVWGRGDAAAVDALFAADVVDHNAFPGQPPGVEGVKQIVALFRAAFPDLQITNEEILADGDRAVLRWNAQGTHQGELAGIPATGKRVRMTGIDILRIADGKVVERWGEYNSLELMQQLGVIPAPDSPVSEVSGDDASRTTNETSTASPEENKALIRRYWQEASTRGLPAVVEEFLAPDVVSHPPASASAEPIRGLAAFKQFIATQFGAFSDMAFTVEDLIAEGDRVAARVTTRGTHAGELMGLPPTGRRVEWSGISMTRHAGGKIVEQWGEFDALSLLQQLGVVPSPGEVPA